MGPEGRPLDGQLAPDRRKTPLAVILSRKVCGDCVQTDSVPIYILKTVGYSISCPESVYDRQLVDPGELIEKISHGR